MSEFNWAGVTKEPAKIPDGTYTGSFYKYEIAASKFDGIFRANFQIKILEGDYKNRLLFKSYKLEAPDYGKPTMSMYRDLITLGLKDEKDHTHPSETQLQKIFDSMLGKVCEFTVKTSKLPNGNDYQGCFIKSYESSAKLLPSGELPPLNMNESFPF